MSAPESTFYVTGGTLRQDAASYVERQADKDLLDGLLRGEFCYVLTSRQMGKSSLMVRTAGKLREQAVQVVVLDLTAIGQNLTPEQWYDGLLVRLGRQLDLEDELEEFWEAHRQLGPCQRLFAALRDVVLGKLADKKEREGDDSPTPQLSTFNFQPSTAAARLVLFVDELDVVRSLPFSTDEFFAAIRECYNRRTEDAEFNRLTFCLLGVATPSDLIRDTRTTPFNIGQRIVLNDFTEAEAAPLANGLENPKLETRNSKLLLERILYWTNGHPYLTQRLCRAVAERCSRQEEAHSGQSAIRNPQSAICHSLVDELCTELFFSPRAREQDDNLLFVRERLLRSEVELPALLQLYEQVHRGISVPDDETNPLVSVLRLSGIVRSQDGQLVERNRIYERVFDRAWIRANMPDAEVRRQRAAFRRGLARAASLAFLVVVVVTGLALVALRQAHRAEHTAKALRKNLYLADMGTVQQALQENNLGRATLLIGKYSPKPGEEDLRGLEWRYLWQLCQGEETFTLHFNDYAVNAVTFSPDGRLLALASLDDKVTILDVTTKRVLLRLNGFFRSHNSQNLTFSPDGELLAAADKRAVNLWRTKDWQLSRRLEGESIGGSEISMSFSPDGQALAIASNGKLSFWDVSTGRERAPGNDIPLGFFGYRLAYRTDGKTLAVASGAEIQLWDVISRSKIANFTGKLDRIMSLAWSSQWLAAGSWDGGLKIWDIERSQEIVDIKAHPTFAFGLAFAPDGKTLVTGGGDQKICFWDVASLRSQASAPNEPQKHSALRKMATLQGHLHEVWALAFSPDGRTLVSGGKDGTARFWSGIPKADERVLAEARQALRFSDDEKSLLTLNNNGTLSDWDLQSRQKFRVIDLGFAANQGGPATVSSDGKTLAVSMTNGTVELWSIETRQRITTHHAPKGEIQSLRFSPRGKLLALLNGQLLAGELKQSVTVLNLTAGQPEVRFDETANGFAFSPDETLFAVSMSDYSIIVRNLATRMDLSILKMHTRAVRSLAFSPDGKRFMSSSVDNTIRLWDTASWTELDVLRGHMGGVHAAAFSPDGNLLASISADKALKLWNISTIPAQELLSLRTAPRYPRSVMFSPDNSILAVYSTPDITGGSEEVLLLRAPSFAEIEASEMAKTAAQAIIGRENKQP